MGLFLFYGHCIGEGFLLVSMFWVWFCSRGAIFVSAGFFPVFALVLFRVFIPFYINAFFADPKKKGEGRNVVCQSCFM